MPTRVLERLPMHQQSELIHWRQLVLREFAGEVVCRHVGRDEFCDLLLSRRPLTRCDDNVSHRYGLFDAESGELFDIDESELYAET